MSQIFNIGWYLLAQTQAAGTASGSTTDEVSDAVADKPAGLFDGPMGFLFPIMMVLVVYFLFMSKPKEKGQVKNTELLASLKKNDRVQTAGGILGTIVNVRTDEEFVTLRIDDSSNARMQVMASSIVRVLDGEEKDSKS